MVTFGESLSSTLSSELFCMGKKDSLTTDVLLARSRCPGAGHLKLWTPPQKHINLNDLWSYGSTAILWIALCEEKTETLPAFHAFSGSDTGRFSQIDKTIWLKIYTRADPHAVKALGMLYDDIRCPPWQHLCVLIMHQRASRSTAFPSCDGQVKPSTHDVLPAPRPLLRWLDAIVKRTVVHSSVRADQWAWHVQISVWLCSTQCQNDENSRSGMLNDDSDNDVWGVVNVP